MSNMIGLLEEVEDTAYLLERFSKELRELLNSNQCSEKEFRNIFRKEISSLTTISLLTTMLKVLDQETNLETLLTSKSVFERELGKTLSELTGTKRIEPFLDP